MNQLYSPAPAAHRPAVDWLGPLFGALFVVAVGVVLGVEYVTPEKRSLSVLAALVVFGIAWRIDTLSGIGFMIVALPFPRGTVFGSTNVAFVMLVVLMWLLRVSQRQSPPPHRTPLDLPVMGLSLAYVVSFYNIEKAAHFPRAVENTLLYAATLMLFYVVVNNVRNERDLKRIHLFQGVTLVVVLLLAVWELRHPGAALFKGWIEFRGTTGMDFNTRNVRVGGPFFDFELLSEYCALNLMLVLFWLHRSRTMAFKTLYAGLGLLTVFILFATVTRGAFVSLGVALPYLLWRIRRRLRVVPFAICLAITVALFFGTDYYVSHFTRSGDVIARLLETRFINGMPEARSNTWPQAWGRLLEHPFIGHGPYYSVEHGLTYWYWPHDIYLYVGNLVGFVGLFFFLWILARLFILSLPHTDNLADPSYAEGFLLVTSAQLLLFFVNEVKIEYLRNPIYQFQIWLWFATIISAIQIARRQRLGQPELA